MRAKWILLCGVILAAIAGIVAASIILSRDSSDQQEITYGYECQSSKCVKVLLDEKNFNSAVSFPVCNIFCTSDDVIGTIWPKPTGKVSINNTMVHIDPSRITVNSFRNDYWDIAKERFLGQVKSKYEGDAGTLVKGGDEFIINFVTPDKNDVQKLILETDESYKLEIQKNIATITANNFYGARHGLETLSQLLVYDDIRREIQVAGAIEINDKPAYKHRGIVLDTSRNYYSTKIIKNILDTMGMVKLNTFHWHITDTHSFPFELKSRPNMHRLGSYSSKKVYTHEDIRKLVKYGRAVGVRLIPEFDQPAHIGEGWDPSHLTCFKSQPWASFCVEPPCGQVNPAVPDVYNVLEDIYAEMYEAFDAPDYFHIGGDEVSAKCWNSSASLQKYMLDKGWSLEENDFMKLWGEFQVRALERFDKVTKTPHKVPVIFWTSRLTEVPFVDKYLDPERYTIQIWTTGDDPKIMDLLQRGYKLIMSNYDALYLDCGFGGWVNDGLNWCAPYSPWHKIYENKPKELAGIYANSIIGSEAAIWSEQIDDFTIENRLWPRASALAERLWSDPVESWRSAEQRMLIHRERLVELGVAAESIQPEWCLKNKGDCPIIKNF